MNSKSKRLIEGLRAIERDIERTEQEITKLEGKAASIANMLTEAPGTRHMALGDILSPNQIQAVVDILNRPSLSDTDQTKLLKEYLGTIREELAVKGVLPEYLAYVLIASADRLRSISAGLN